MRQTGKLLAAAIAGALGISVCVLVTPSSGDSGSPTTGQVGICHATGSTSHPFVFITPDASGVYDGHAGLGHQYGEDIIPAFSYVNAHGETVNFAGQNLSTLYGGAAGSVLLANKCEKPPTTTQPPSTSTVTTAVTVTNTVTNTVTLSGQTVTAPAQTITQAGQTVTAPTQTVTGQTQTVATPGKTVTITREVVGKPVVKVVTKVKPCVKRKPKPKVHAAKSCPPGSKLYHGSCHKIVKGNG